MPRISQLASALALALAGVSSAQAQSFSDVINFGDSLSDGGNYANLIPGAGSFTTNPDPVAIELVAAEYGIVLTPSLATNNGGFNFAWGGAPTGPGFVCVPTTLPCRNGTTQLANYFARTGGVADPNALYSVWLGANNMLNILGGAPAATALPATIQQNLGIVGALQAAGAQHIIVYNLPDIGRTPFGLSQGANAATISQLIGSYNANFNDGLAQLGDGIISINTFALINEVLNDPTLYGFTNSTSPACNLAVVPGSLFCNENTLVAPGAQDNYVFADGVHPTGAMHELLANVVIATIAAPGQVSLASEVPLQVYDNHSHVINNQLFGMADAERSGSEANVYGHLQGTRQEFGGTANTAPMDNDLFTGTFGADVRYTDAISVGAAITFGGSDGDIGNGASIEGKEVLASAYGAFHFGSGYINAIATGGSSNLDIDRSIVLGPTTRVEHGSTSASHRAFEVGAGFSFGSDSFKHGPFASVTWQKVQVDGYAEEGSDGTAMNFSDFERKSTVGRIGYQAQGHAGSVQPFGRIAFARDSNDDVTTVNAGSNTMNGRFTLDGFQAARDWVEADVGVNWDINDTTALSLSYRARLSDDTQDQHSLNFGVRMEF